jgi:hypothetical protein
MRLLAGITGMRERIFQEGVGAVDKGGRGGVYVEKEEEEHAELRSGTDSVNRAQSKGEGGAHHSPQFPVRSRVVLSTLELAVRPTETHV